jgi:chromosome segregation ATPase
MPKILNLVAATAILSEQLDHLQTRRADLLSQMSEIEKELGELNPQIAKLETVFKSPSDAAPTPAVPVAS